MSREAKIKLESCSWRHQLVRFQHRRTVGRRLDNGRASGSATASHSGSQGNTTPAHHLQTTQLALLLVGTTYLTLSRRSLISPLRANRFSGDEVHTRLPPFPTHTACQPSNVKWRWRNGTIRKNAHVHDVERCRLL